MLRSLLALLVPLLAPPCARLRCTGELSNCWAEEARTTAGAVRESLWNGCQRLDFSLDGRACLLVVPHAALQMLDEYLAILGVSQLRGANPSEWTGRPRSRSPES